MPHSLALQWTEAAEMQVALGRPAQAAFCVEEALLAAPSNAALHARLAEVSVDEFVCMGQALRVCAPR